MPTSFMERTPVESTNVVSVGYNPVVKTLEIEYKNGKVYQYFDVGARVHRELMESRSKGSFIGMSINGLYKTLLVS